MPSDVNDAVLKALQRDPEQRFATARDFAIALEAAIVVSPPHRVGEWVQELAGLELDARMRKVAQIERYAFAVTDDFTPNPVTVGSIPQARSSDDATQKDVLKARATASDPPDFRPRRRKPLLVGLGLLLVIGGGAYALSSGPETPPVRSDSLAPLPSSLPAPNAPLPTPPQQQPDAGPSASAAASSAAPRASAAVPLAKPPVLHGVTPKRAAPAPKSNCKPPWRIDERGIRRLKPGCY